MMVKARPMGILPAHGIENMICEKQINAMAQIAADQIQPASLDVRLGNIAYRIRASFLPGVQSTVMEKLNALAYHEIDLRGGAVLETGCVYLVPLMETLNLPVHIAAFANPKSSTGRIDVFTRLIADYGTAFDAVPAAYKGPLYLEVSPRTFPILVRAGSRLAQIRFRQGAASHEDGDLQRLHDEVGLIDGVADIDKGLAVSIDLQGFSDNGLVGYRGKRHAGLIDVDASAALPVAQYWDPLYRTGEPHIILDPDEFYILASREVMTIPPTHAAEMLPFDARIGEFRVHYAGFFDPGFGIEEAGGKGTHAVLEVRSREVPFVLEHGQIVGRLVYERLTDTPATLYGAGLKSNYQAQGLRLSKHFKQEK